MLQALASVVARTIEEHGICANARKLQRWTMRQEEEFCGVCSEAKDHVEQLSKTQSVLLCMFCCRVLLLWLSHV
jgi:hypothetical protein